jgi:Serine/threonine protein kinase
VADSEIIDDYELINCIATGNATQVWEVRKGGSTQSLAMKILLPEAFKDSEARKNLKHEASVGKSLEHPNIIRIQEVKFTRKHGYFVMEYFRGGNVKSTIRNDKALVKAKAKRIMECLTQALAHMHEKKWIHRDIKPENVLITRGGEVRLIDFSLASRAGNPLIHAMARKSSIQIQGTRTYLAPELIRKEVLTPSVDIYSLGVMLYEMLTGAPPFRTANPQNLLQMHLRDHPAPPTDIDSNITPEAEKLVLKMLAKYPKGRHASMQEVFSEVRNINFFKVDPIEHARALREAEAASDAQQQNDRLDSRKDAERSAMGIKPPPRPASKVVVPPPDIEKPKPAAATPAAAAPVAPAGMPQQPPFGPFPGMPYPGMPMPGFPGAGFPAQQPGMVPGMPPGYPMPPGAMPGMPMPGMPPQYPGMPMPGMPVPPNQPGVPMPVPGAGFPVPGGFPPGTPIPGASVPQPSAPRPAPPQPTGAAPGANAPSNPPPPKQDAPLASLDDLDIQ